MAMVQRRFTLPYAHIRRLQRLAKLVLGCPVFGKTDDVPQIAFDGTAMVDDRMNGLGLVEHNITSSKNGLTTTVIVRPRDHFYSRLSLARVDVFPPQSLIKDPDIPYINMIRKNK
jgi:hypothetical protein